MITVKEIARRCDVSPSTVSNILNGRANVGELTRKKVLECVKETGYQPNYFAQSIRNQSSRVISIITEDLHAFGTNPIVQYAMECCEDYNYRTVLMNLRLYQKWQNTWYEDVEKVKASLSPILQEALAIRVSGIIYVAGHCRVINYFPSDLPVPVLVSYGLSQGNMYPSIIVDDEKGGYDIGKYLINKGHKKIGILAGVSDNLHTKGRLLGYQKALFESGVLYDPSLIYYGDWYRESGYNGAKALLSGNLTAIFCMNDTMAAGVYDYLFDAGITVGKDISVVGFDNMEKSEYLRPQLTTNEIQLVEIGRKSAEELIKILENTGSTKSTYEPIKIPCNVIERESVCNLNGYE
jgi:LacI family transcriptional regulator